MSVTIQRLKQAKDAALIRLFQLGNNRAFDELVKRYERKLKAYLHKLLHNAALEKDVLQNVWIEVIRRFRQHLYQEKGKLPQWLHRVAFRNAITSLRRLKRTEQINEAAAEDIAGQPGEDFDFSDAQIQQAKEGLAQLNKSYRDVIRMRLEEDLPFREIATQTHTDIHTVTSRYSKAIKKLRKIVRRKRK